MNKLLIKLNCFLYKKVVFTLLCLFLHYYEGKTSVRELPSDNSNVCRLFVQNVIVLLTAVKTFFFPFINVKDL